MMLPVLLSEYTVDGSKYDTSDFAVVQDMKQLSVYSDNSKFLHVNFYTQF